MNFSKLLCANFDNPNEHSSLNIPNSLPEEVIEYPSQWFVNGKKPVLTVFKTQRILEHIARQVSVMGGRTDLCYLSLTEFLVMMMNAISDTLLEDWSSFGVSIGKQGDKITPLSLLEVVESASEPESKIQS